ncbi:MurT ligase domain-containing protein [Pseudonocardia hispaniensis]|uniref:Lipid II isoglutaminyl synthase (glutamine-hydrolyzing) subunit MurT n=1 Tax=Pseudonocardia hispaniensis TaxID=904933 RepID=A0ABW1J3V4_9PSEU
MSSPKALDRRRVPGAARRARDRWTELAVRAGLVASWVSRRLGLGAGSIIGGRVTLALDPTALARLASGRRVVLVSGTNGKTTTSHLLAAALGTAGRVAHNATGSNMADGAVAALAHDREAEFAVIEVDELHLAKVAEAVDPVAIILLNLSRDQLDRGTEVRAVASAIGAALSRHPQTTVVANTDDPMVVWTASQGADQLWVSVGNGWSGDTSTCPRCGRALDATGERWVCACGLTRPVPAWRAAGGAAVRADATIPITLGIPGRFNLGNAVMALAAASILGVEPCRAAHAMGELEAVAGRYDVVTYRGHELRLLLAKNPAGWSETIGLLDEARSLMVVINAREADGRDTSWLWDVPFEQLTPRPVVAAGERAADLGVRLSYAEIDHQTASDPLAGLSLLPPGKVDLVANYTAFHQLRRRLAAEGQR